MLNFLDSLIAKPAKGSAGKTGLWRTFRPVYDESKCVKCLLCWLYCPEGVIYVEGDRISIDYEYCKGCGICAKVCNKNAIEMVVEE
jgi:pyruvate ferredoxin oxidoreductase delta subunit